MVIMGTPFANYIGDYAISNRGPEQACVILQAESSRFCIRPYLQSHDDEGEPAKPIRAQSKSFSQLPGVAEDPHSNGPLHEVDPPMPPSLFAEASRCAESCTLQT